MDGCYSIRLLVRDEFYRFVPQKTSPPMFFDKDTAAGAARIWVGAYPETAIVVVGPDGNELTMVQADQDDIDLTAWVPEPETWFGPAINN